MEAWFAAHPYYIDQSCRTVHSFSSVHYNISSQKYAFIPVFWGNFNCQVCKYWSMEESHLTHLLYLPFIWLVAQEERLEWRVLFIH